MYIHTCVSSITHARIANVYTASLFTHLHKTTQFYILCPNSAEETYRFDQNGPSLTNHLYWVPSSTSEGEDEVKWEKWASVFRHAQNIFITAMVTTTDNVSIEYWSKMTDRRICSGHVIG